MSLIHMLTHHWAVGEHRCGSTCGQNIGTILGMLPKVTLMSHICFLQPLWGLSLAHMLTHLHV